jgi:hypothetical protein
MEPLIPEVRDIRVMLDRDLAVLYGVEMRALNQAVPGNQPIQASISRLIFD